MIPGARKIADCGPGDMTIEFENEPGVQWRARLVQRPRRPKLLLLVRHGNCPKE